MMASAAKKTTSNKIRFIQILLIFSTLSFSLQPISVQADSPASIQTTDLHLSIKDVARVEFGYHHSSFESYHVEYNLDVKAGILTDGNVNTPISSLTPLLSGLTGMYPGTRPLYWDAWSDDYPHAWIRLYLNDGKMVQINSDSQFEGMFPWNVSVWGSEKAANPDASYIQLNPKLLEGIDFLWRRVGEEGFPRIHSDEFFLQDILSGSTSENIIFHGEDSPDTAFIGGNGPASLSLFLPELNRNHEIKSLLDEGYTIYDAIFSLDVQAKNLQTIEPVQYSGTLALATPDGKDVIIGLVTIPLEDAQSVTTTIDATESKRLVKQRQSSKFLNQANQLLADLTFLLDLREASYLTPTLDCPENPNLSLDGKIIEAIWSPVEPMRVNFYPLINKQWSVDLSMQRDDPNWDDKKVQTILKSWFPESIASIPVKNIQEFSSRWGISFQPDVTLHDPQLLDRLSSNLPEQTVIHEQNPEKAGDYGFLSLAGRLIISENETPPVVVNCGVTLPDWYGPEYSIDAVVPPNEQAPRNDLPGILGENNQWHSLGELIEHKQYSSTYWTSIAFTQPGFLHVLWSNERDGVYYADGWINGTGWSEPQRLGDEAYWIDMRAWPDGEIHLFWDTGLSTKGSIHIWRPAGGAWQKPEHWPIDFFSEIVRDSNGILHIGGIESDGLDSEFMHRTWSPENGLSAPENISRQIGSIGNTTSVLRLDSNGQLHAAWSHILEHKSAPDPLTGETSDIAGIFYAYQLPDGHWSKPEQIGVLAAYAYAMSMELDSKNNPLVIWQTESGLFSRIKKNGTWQNAVELAKVIPPETPAEFGPERQVQPTAELQTAVNTLGQIVAGWLIPYSGLEMDFWSDDGWTGNIDIVDPKERASLQINPQTLEMTIDNQDRVHFVYFKDNDLFYSLYDHKKIESQILSITYDYYGLPEAGLLVDTAGSVAVLGLPRSPSFKVKIPIEGIPPTPIPTPIPTLTQIPENTLTPLQRLNNSDNSDRLALIAIGLVMLLVLSVVVRVAVKLRKK